MPELPAEQPAPIFFLDADHSIRGSNDPARKLLGYEVQELQGADLEQLFRKPAAETGEAGLTELMGEAHLTEGASRRVTLTALHRDGTPLPLEATVSLLPGPNSGWVVILHHPDPDTPGETEAAGGEHYDTDTHLPTRQLYTERLEQATQRLIQHGRRAAVVLLDLDRFKRINHTLGFPQGDQLLALVAQRLEEQLRPGDTVARFGEDEFAVLLNDLARVEDIYPLGLRLLNALEQPFHFAGQEIFLTASAGISVFPDDSRSVPTLLRQAGMAQAISKNPYHNNCSFFTEDLNERAWHRLQLESDLNRALRNDELVLHYQPVVSLVDGSIKGVEALVRWHHPERGMVSPGEFIPLLEDIGLIQDVGDWVARTAVAQLAEWRRRELPPVRMNINLSPRQFAQPDLVERLTAIVDEAGINPGILQLEITENLFMHEIPDASNMLHQLHEAGFPLALDDFGTGYSALNYLRSYPFRVLKIDRSFLWHIPTDLEETALLRSIVDLADTLNIPTVPEGIETQDQADFLQWLGCTEGQGFGFSRPVPAEDLARMLEAGPNFPIRL
jgi:diguanylate cyclase (GGDEF)-like protein/PAS domain S-box-containing protein